MTIHDCAAQLRQEANARGGSTLLLWAADTLEQMHKPLPVPQLHRRERMGMEGKT